MPLKRKYPMRRKRSTFSRYKKKRTFGAKSGRKM